MADPIEGAIQPLKDEMIRACRGAHTNTEVDLAFLLAASEFTPLSSSEPRGRVLLGRARKPGAHLLAAAHDQSREAETLPMQSHQRASQGCVLTLQPAFTMRPAGAVHHPNLYDGLWVNCVDGILT